MLPKKSRRNKTFLCYDRCRVVWGNMKRIINFIKYIIFLLVAFLICLTVFHHIMLSKEFKEIKPIGQMVGINGKKMSIYVEGEGEKTLVFLAGAGTASPILDFKSLYSKLTNDYRIVVVEKFGYGFSDNTQDSRDNATLLAETRSALKKSGISGPYVLIPHSMSGIQALYWVKHFPEEVEAIIGLDMSLPSSYEKMKISHFLLSASSLGMTLGLSRLLPPSMISAIADGDLTEEEKSLYMKLVHRNLANPTVILESKAIQANAKEVRDFQPQIPTLLFISNGQGTGFNKEHWQSFQLNYIEEIEDGSYQFLDVPHYLHDVAYEEISQKIKEFLDKR